jgi:hypothetical protein
MSMGRAYEANRRGIKLSVWTKNLRYPNPTSPKSTPSPSTGSGSGPPPPSPRVLFEHMTRTGRPGRSRARCTPPPATRRSTSSSLGERVHRQDDWSYRRATSRCAPTTPTTASAPARTSSTSPVPRTRRRARHLTEHRGSALHALRAAPPRRLHPRVLHRLALRRTVGRRTTRRRRGRGLLRHRDRAARTAREGPRLSAAPTS